MRFSLRVPVMDQSDCSFTYNYDLREFTRVYESLQVFYESIYKL